MQDYIDTIDCDTENLTDWAFHFQEHVLTVKLGHRDRMSCVRWFGVVGGSPSIRVQPGVDSQSSWIYVY